MFFIVTVNKILLCLFGSNTVFWEIIENYFDIWHYIDDIKEGEFGKDADLRISLNWTVIRDNDVSGRRFEERTSIKAWTSIWVYHIYVRYIIL